MSFPAIRGQLARSVELALYSWADLMANRRPPDVGAPFRNPALSAARAAQKRFRKAETHEEKMIVYRELRDLLDKTRAP